MSEDLPNLGKLIKLLKMTTSSNDSEAIAFMRRANLELEKFGGDWESLLRGKVTVIGDPFDGVEAPKHQASRTSPAIQPVDYTYVAPVRPRQAPRPTRSPIRDATYWAQKDAKDQAHALKVDADAARARTQPRTNLYAAKCRICGTHVPAKDGQLIGTSNGWRVECNACHKGSTAQAQNAPTSGRKRGAFSLDTLANIIDDKESIPF